MRVGGGRSGFSPRCVSSLRSAPPLRIHPDLPPPTLTRQGRERPWRRLWLGPIAWGDGRPSRAACGLSGRKMPDTLERVSAADPMAEAVGVRDRERVGRRVAGSAGAGGSRSGRLRRPIRERDGRWERLAERTAAPPDPRAWWWDGAPERFALRVCWVVRAGGSWIERRSRSICERGVGTGEELFAHRPAAGVAFGGSRAWRPWPSRMRLGRGIEPCGDERARAAAGAVHGLGVRGSVEVDPGESAAAGATEGSTRGED